MKQYRWTPKASYQEKSQITTKKGRQKAYVYFILNEVHKETKIIHGNWNQNSGGGDRITLERAQVTFGDDILFIFIWVDGYTGVYTGIYSSIYDGLCLHFAIGKLHLKSKREKVCSIYKKIYQALVYTLKTVQ